MIEKIQRQLSFALRVPPRQIARRAWLKVRRAAEARLRPPLEVAGLTRVERPPLPLFPPRTGLARRTDAGWAFRFLGREVRTDGGIDWRAPGPGAGDQLWRMNLHYMEYLEEAEDADLAAAIERWIEANPPYAPGSTGDAWNAYALSLRTLVWMQQLARRDLPAAVALTAERSLAAQLLYLERHLETDVGGNHLIKNAKALLWASAFFAGPAAARWRETGLALLERELPRQILADGMHFERSPSYHCQVFADLLEIRHALGADPLGGALDRALGGMARAAADLAHPDGRVAQFGDAGLSMAYPPGACLAAHAALFGDAPAPRAVFAFADAGYYGVRQGGDAAIVDAGRIAPPELPAHGHGDIGSFEWSLAGRRIVIDQGVFEYVSGPKRQASRTAASHNTLWIEGSDQAEFFGAFRCGRQARAEPIEYEPAPGGFRLAVRHDGFRRLSGGPLHERRFEVGPRRIRIEDRLHGGAGGTARIGLLLHPSAAVQQIETGQWRITCGNAAALVRASAALRAEPAVWWPDMGIELPTSRLVIELAPHVREAWVELEAEPGHEEGRGL